MKVKVKLFAWEDHREVSTIMIDLPFLPQAGMNIKGTAPSFVNEYGLSRGTKPIHGPVHFQLCEPDCWDIWVDDGEFQYITVHGEIE